MVYNHEGRHIYIYIYIKLAPADQSVLFFLTFLAKMSCIDTRGVALASLDVRRSSSARPVPSASEEHNVSAPLFGELFRHPPSMGSLCFDTCLLSRTGTGRHRRRQPVAPATSHALMECHADFKTLGGPCTSKPLECKNGYEGCLNLQSGLKRFKSHACTQR